MVPLGRMGTPEDVAAVVMLVSDRSAAYLTGQVIPVDGGLSSGRFGIPSSG
jgi:3-oxoacyl-[acyl-carrier protein] reductase